MESPADHPPARPPSLAGLALLRARQGAGAVARRITRFDLTKGKQPASTPWPPVALAVLIASIPLSIWAGGRWLEAGERARIAVAERQLAPRRAAAKAEAEERAGMAALLARPRAIAVLNALAETLPADARIVRMSRDGTGVLTLEVATPDPAELRAALRGDARFAALRSIAERRGDAGMVVTLKGTDE